MDVQALMKSTPQVLTIGFRLPRWLAVSVLLAFLALATGGCGGCGRKSPSGDPFAKWGGMSKEEWLKQKAERDAAKAKEEEEAKKKAEAARQQKARQQAAEAKRRADELAAAKGKSTPKESAARIKAAAQQELPPLPAAVADWQDKDFLLARITGDPMLVPAVNYVASHRVGDDGAARLLGRLLQPSTLGELREEIGGLTRRRSSARSSRKSSLVEAIIAALGANDTDVARQFLRTLVTGEFETEDDKTAAFAALKALVDHPGAENEAILFHLLVSPDEVRLPDCGDVTADQLRSQALTWLEPTASVQLRLRLARSLVDGQVTGTVESSLESLLTSPHPSNLEAQIVLYQASLAGRAALGETIEGNFFGYSSQALGELFGLPRPEQPPPDEADLSSRVAEWLWGPQFQGLLGLRLARLNSFKEAPEATLLACTMPDDATRSNLYQLVRRCWYEGPATFEPFVSGESFCDPGLLVVLKLSDRENQPVSPPGNRAYTPSERDKIDEVMKARREMAEDWEEAIMTFLESQCRHFETAADQRAIYGRRPSAYAASRPAAADLPTALYPDTEVVATYRLDWPNIAGTASAVLPPGRIRVRYVQIRGEMQEVAVGGFFRRQFKSPIEREAEHGQWIDAVRDGHEPGRLESVDVRIRPAAPDRPTLPNEKQLMIVDILSVEIRDPGEPPSKTGPKAGGGGETAVGAEAAGTKASIDHAGAFVHGDS